jgi:hypothetical protein
VPQLGHDFKTAAHRHADVEDQHVPGFRPDGFQHFLAVGRLAHFGVRKGAQNDMLDAQPDHGVVVGDQEPQCGGAKIRVVSKRLGIHAHPV